MSVAGRAAVAMLVSVTMCGVGYAAFVMSIHGSTPLLTTLQWLGLPILALVAESPAELSETFYILTVVLSGGLWFILVFMLLPRKRTILSPPSP